jgi:hypothetical protein
LRSKRRWETVCGHKTSAWGRAGNWRVHPRKRENDVRTWVCAVYTPVAETRVSNGVAVWQWGHGCRVQCGEPMCSLPQKESVRWCPHCGHANKLRKPQAERCATDACQGICVSHPWHDGSGYDCLGQRGLRRTSSGSGYDCLGSDCQRV